MPDVDFFDHLTQKIGAIQEVPYQDPPRLPIEMIPEYERLELFREIEAKNAEARKVDDSLADVFLIERPYESSVKVEFGVEVSGGKKYSLFEGYLPHDSEYIAHELEATREPLDRSLYAPKLRSWPAFHYALDSINSDPEHEMKFFQQINGANELHRRRNPKLPDVFTEDQSSSRYKCLALGLRFADSRTQDLSSRLGTYSLNETTSHVEQGNIDSLDHALRGSMDERATLLKRVDLINERNRRLQPSLPDFYFEHEQLDMFERLSYGVIATDGTRKEFFRDVEKYDYEHITRAIEEGYGGSFAYFLGEDGGWNEAYKYRDLEQGYRQTFNRILEKNREHREKDPKVPKIVLRTGGFTPGIISELPLPLHTVDPYWAELRVKPPGSWSSGKVVYKHAYNFDTRKVEGQYYDLRKKSAR